MSVERHRMIRFADFYRGRCAKSTAYKWVKEGKLKLYQLGNMFFTDETFDDFVERQAAERAASAQNPEANQQAVYHRPRP